jgi:hypothetical protein
MTDLPIWSAGASKTSQDSIGALHMIVIAKLRIRLVLASSITNLWTEDSGMRTHPPGSRSPNAAKL